MSDLNETMLEWLAKEEEDDCGEYRDVDLHIKDWAKEAKQLTTHLRLLVKACRAEGYLPDASDRTNNRICTALAIIGSE